MNLTESLQALLDNECDAGPTRCFDAGKGMQALGSQETLLLILQTVLDSLASDVAAIQKWESEGELRSIKRTLHAMKGFVPLICADGLVQKVRLAEELDPMQKPKEAASAYRELLPMFEQLRVEVTAYMSSV